METILKVIVGSQAHGLATPTSDFDYRGVYVESTSKILSLNYKYHGTSWLEGDDDDTSWEIGHFLNLSIHCNPTILETFISPIQESDEFGKELRELFSKVWNSNGVKNAFIGYGLNQRKKFFDNKDNRASKYAVAYLRTLYQAYELLGTGTFSVNMTNTPVFSYLKKWKTMTSIEVHQIAGEVIEQCLGWEFKVNQVYESHPKKETDLEAVNDFLLKVRRANW